MTDVINGYEAPDVVPESVAKMCAQPFLQRTGLDWDQVDKLTLSSDWVEITYRDGEALVTRLMPVR